MLCFQNLPVLLSVLSSLFCSVFDVRCGVVISARVACLCVSNHCLRSPSFGRLFVSLFWCGNKLRSKKAYVRTNMLMCCLHLRCRLLAGDNRMGWPEKSGFSALMSCRTTYGLTAGQRLRLWDNDSSMRLELGETSAVLQWFMDKIVHVTHDSNKAYNVKIVFVALTPSLEKNGHFNVLVCMCVWGGFLGFFHWIGSGKQVKSCQSNIWFGKTGKNVADRN